MKVMKKTLRLEVSKRKLTYFLLGSITVQLTSCLTGLDSTKRVNLLLILTLQSYRIQTSQTGCKPYSDTSPYIVRIFWVNTCFNRPYRERPIYIQNQFFCNSRKKLAMQAAAAGNWQYIDKNLSGIGSICWSILMHCLWLYFSQQNPLSNIWLGSSTYVMAHGNREQL